MTGIDPRVLSSPCWLEEYLEAEGVAEVDWSHEIPGPVIAVVQAMHRAGSTLQDIADRFERARAQRRAVRARAVTVPRPDGMEDEFGDLPEDTRLLFPEYPLGGQWEPTPEAVAQVLDAPGRREHRKTSRPVLLAAQRRAALDQPGLFELEAS